MKLDFQYFFHLCNCKQEEKTQYWHYKQMSLINVDILYNLKKNSFFQLLAIE